VRWPPWGGGAGVDRVTGGGHQPHAAGVQPGSTRSGGRRNDARIDPRLRCASRSVAVRSPVAARTPPVTVCRVRGAPDRPAAGGRHLDAPVGAGDQLDPAGMTATTSCWTLPAVKPVPSTRSLTLWSAPAAAMAASSTSMRPTSRARRRPGEGGPWCRSVGADGGHHRPPVGRSSRQDHRERRGGRSPSGQP
jgi:hypothetical protein